MRLAVLGATGRAGAAIMRHARAAAHEVHALTRSPGTLTRDDPQATVTTGNVRDPAATGRAVRGADAVISAVGSLRRRAPPGNLTAAATPPKLLPGSESPRHVPGSGGPGSGETCASTEAPRPHYSALATS